jgi:hypothetical protein
MSRWVAIITTLAVLGTPAVSHAEKLPTDEGLKVTLSPGTTKMRVGQAVEFTMSFTDDDAVSVETSLDVEGVGGTGMAGDGACSSPLQRTPMDGRALALAKFKKPGKYVVRGVVTTSACHGTLTGMGTERVTITRTITVTR